MSQWFRCSVSNAEVCAYHMAQDRTEWPEIPQPYTDWGTWYGSERPTLKAVGSLWRYARSWCKPTTMLVVVVMMMMMRGRRGGEGWGQKTTTRTTTRDDDEGDDKRQRQRRRRRRGRRQGRRRRGQRRGTTTRMTTTTTTRTKIRGDDEGQRQGRRRWEWRRERRRRRGWCICTDQVEERVLMSLVAMAANFQERSLSVSSDIPCWRRHSGHSASCQLNHRTRKYSLIYRVRHKKQPPKKNWIIQKRCN